jgi:chemotaxis protein methyltransferase CheR
MVDITQKEFEQLKNIVYKECSIYLSAKQMSSVKAKLQRIMTHTNVENVSEYLGLIKNSPTHMQEFINEMTVNETYFFRENDHFIFVKRLYEKRGKLRIWSAASSIGVEAYTIAMITGGMCEILGTDINDNVIKKARMGFYPESMLNNIPSEYVSKYCLKGRGRYEGNFLIDRKLVLNISFQKHNLAFYNASYGLFDVIFLRNVLIYFDVQTKQKVVDNLVKNLKVGGYFIISHTENLNDLSIPYFKKVQPSIFQKVENY